MAKKTRHGIVQAGERVGERYAGPRYDPAPDGPIWCGAAFHITTSNGRVMRIFVNQNVQRSMLNPLSASLWRAGYSTLSAQLR